jgi:cytochrome d ubiquinol oxidase subunit I
MPYRLAHMLIASGLTVAFLLAGMSAWRWLRGDRGPAVAVALRTGVIMAAILAPTQLVVGDLHGLNTLEHQPAKIAAMEGNWQTRGNVPLVLFGIPDERAKENRFEIAIPSGASLILKHSPSGVVPGLDQFEGLHPPVKPVFYAFRVMVGTGLAMVALALLGAGYLWRRGTLPTLLLRGFVLMTFSGWLATLAGWYVTEIGRQPWLVTGVLTTAQAAGPVPAASIGTTLAMYLTLYALLLSAYIATLYRLAAKGRISEAVPGNAPIPQTA